MKAVFQRVYNASVTVDGRTTGSIGAGALILLGVLREDTEAHAALMAQKIANLRVFTDDQDKMNLSLLDIGGEALVVSNFTLAANCSHGRRPEFFAAARPEQAEPLYERFMDELRALGIRVASGEFGADMTVNMNGEGPVTILLDTADWEKKT
ncbi:MAG: D-tyrosyl-tRNA(Tyr) deacylase [Clostridia bacterium]|nr:D-tyrosyl-tRNA(Tyr) deacylase [Clostridia bacterium]